MVAPLMQYPSTPPDGTTLGDSSLTQTGTGTDVTCAEDLNVASGKTFNIDGTIVLDRIGTNAFNVGPNAGVGADTSRKTTFCGVEGYWH